MNESSCGGLEKGLKQKMDDDINDYFPIKAFDWQDSRDALHEVVGCRRINPPR